CVPLCPPTARSIRTRRGATWQAVHAGLAALPSGGYACGVEQSRRPKAAAARAAARTADAPRPPTAPWLETYVLAASFLVGGIILVVEILGTRVVSPYYGASIYVWSSLIGVTLGALTIGYLAGGWAADRWPALTALAAEVVGGALYLLLVPGLRRAILVATTPLGLK